jgi:Cupin
VLSEVLKVVKLRERCSTTGSFPLRGAFAHRHRATSRPLVAAGAEHVIIDHLLTEGRASARVEDGEHLTLDAGDVVIFPHGDRAHY